jgi:hypothetical protein
VTPARETDLGLPNDSFVEILLPTDVYVSLFGVPYDKLYVGSNGYVTFTSGDTAYNPTAAAHFSLPRVSGLFADFGTVAGSGVGMVSFIELADRFVITYLDVQHYPSSEPTGPNSFQIELFLDGRIRLTYLGISIRGGIVGLSKGGGIPAGFVESDISRYSPMPAAPTDLTAGGMSADAALLRWVDNSDFDVEFFVQRKKEGEAFSTIAIIPTGEVQSQFKRVMNFTDEGLSPSTDYTYRVFAANKECTSDPTSEATARTRPVPSPAPPPAPVSFIIHPIRPDEADQLQIGASLYMRKRNRQWNAVEGSEWCVVRILDGAPRKIVLRQTAPLQAGAEWTLRDDQLREHFDIRLAPPGPPAKMLHLEGSP